MSDETTDSTYGAIASGIKAEGEDACEKALASNWTAILASSLLEMVQWVWDYFLFKQECQRLWLLVIPFQLLQKLVYSAPL